MPKAWQFTWDGEVYRESDLTVGQAERICEKTGQSWITIEPARSPVHMKWVLATMVSDKTGTPADDLAAKVDGMPLTAVLDLIEIVDSDEPTEFRDGVPTEAGPETAT